jgi:hypothetical protein
MILKLRDDYQKLEGDNFLKGKCYDFILDNGMPPSLKPQYLVFFTGTLTHDLYLFGIACTLYYRAVMRHFKVGK